MAVDLASRKFNIYLRNVSRFGMLRGVNLGGGGGGGGWSTPHGEMVQSVSKLVQLV